MKLETRTLKAETITVRDRWGRPVETHLPEETFTYAPTLGKVHNWLWEAWGPLYVTWRDGWLCPWSSSVGQKNMTCSKGRRGHCPGIGLLIEGSHVYHLDPPCQRRLTGRVVCYEWAHVLGHAYWDLITDERETIHALPDDPRFVSVWILRRVLERSGWRDWRYEKDRRANKRWSQWLQPWKPRDK